MVSQLDFYSWKLRDGRLLQDGFPMEILTKIRYLIIFDYHIFRSRAFTAWSSKIDHPYFLRIFHLTLMNERCHNVPTSNLGV